MARPAKSNSSQRGKFIGARMTPAELDAFDGRAKSAGLSRSDYLRQVALAGRVVIQKAGAVNPLLVAQLVKLGTNLNQLARAANANGRVPDDLGRLCQKIDAVVTEAISREVE